MSIFSRTALIAVVSVLALLGAACGDSAEDSVDEVTDSLSEAAEDAEEAVDDAVAEATTFEVSLTGDAEVPGPGADGSGTATVTVDAEQVCVEGSVDGVEPISAGHIHEGESDAAGGVVVDLGVTTGDDGAFDSCGEVDAVTAAEIIANPSGFYLNLHNESFPDGAVRGQLA